MARPPDTTRQRIVKAAVELFAEHGFDGASVRAIVTKARVNQAAINYHFQGKDGLYLEVLKAAFEAYTHDEMSREQAEALPAHEAVRHFVHQQLRPLLGRDEMSRYMRIFAWESVRPTQVMRKFIATSAAPFVGQAVRLVKRFLPDASEQDLICGAIWLMGQCSVFVRNREHFAHPPFGLKVDDGFVDRLTDLVAGLALQGLARKA
jgi:TetR/AcrR family transcriptional regulator, regulator of cefoperazone and chloramphenicol sensitivity